MVLKIEMFSLEQSLEIRCTIFFLHFIEFGTLGLDDKLGSSNFKPNIQ